MLFSQSSRISSPIHEYLAVRNHSAPKGPKEKAHGTAHSQPGPVLVQYKAGAQAQDCPLQKTTFLSHGFTSSAWVPGKLFDLTFLQDQNYFSTWLLYQSHPPNLGNKNTEYSAPFQNYRKSPGWKPNLHSAGRLGPQTVCIGLTPVLPFLALWAPTATRLPHYHFYRTGKWGWYNRSYHIQYLRIQELKYVKWLEEYPHKVLWKLSLLRI